MKSVDLKELVRQAVGGEWDGFAARHPQLSRVVDRELLVERCLEDLRSSQEFQAELRQVQLAGLAHGVLQELVTKVVRGAIALI